MWLRKVVLALILVLVSLPIGAAQSSWVATFGHVGPLKLGMPLAVVSKVFGEHFSPPTVPEADPTRRCFYEVPKRDRGIELMIIDGRLARIDVVNRGIETANGVSVGDTQAKAAHAYGLRLSVMPAFYDLRDGRFLTVTAANGVESIRFVTLRGRITAYYVGTARTVQYAEGCA
jgi:hypothetical protein